MTVCRHVGLRLAVAPAPRDAVEVAVLDGSGCFVTAHSPHPQEALRWIDYLPRHWSEKGRW